MGIRMKSVKVIDMGDWDDLVTRTYGRPYVFQQQGGCKMRGTEDISVPAVDWSYENDTIVEKCNGPEEGVSFEAWLERDPERKLEGQVYDHELVLWWNRNFYPHVNEVINDLYSRGLLEAGDYTIKIDW